MTHEELLKLASDVMSREEFPEYEGGNRLWAQGYLALSAKLATAEAQCVHLREARQVDIDMLDQMDREHVALSVKLQEAEQEIAAAMVILAPNMPSSGLVDACKQVKQVAISEADNSEKFEAKLQKVQAERDALMVALRQIVDGETECGCEHDDEYCCAGKGDFYCPFCIAAVALAGRSVEASRGEVVTPQPCADGVHEWSNQFGEDWTPEQGTFCDCRQRRWGIEVVAASPAPPSQPMADAAEMLWVVLANVSGGDWTLQTAEWQEAAARWRDNYFVTLKGASAPLNERAEVVKACPHCNEFNGLESTAGNYVCPRCYRAFTEPALWQRVTPSCR